MAVGKKIRDGVSLFITDKTSSTTWNAIATYIVDEKGNALKIDGNYVKTSDNKNVFLDNSTTPILKTDTISNTSVTNITPRAIFDIKIDSGDDGAVTIEDAIEGEAFTTDLWTRKGFSSLQLASGKYAKVDSTTNVLYVYDTASSTSEVGGVYDSDGLPVSDVTLLDPDHTTYNELIFKLITITGAEIWGSTAKIDGPNGDYDGDVSAYTTWDEYIDATDRYLPNSQDTGEDTNKVIRYADGKVWLAKVIDGEEIIAYPIYNGLSSTTQLNVTDEFVDRDTYRISQKALFIDGTDQGKTKESYFMDAEKGWASWIAIYSPTYGGNTITKDSSGYLKVLVATGDERYLVDSDGNRIDGTSTSVIDSGTILYLEPPAVTVTLKSCWGDTTKTYTIPQGYTWSKFISLKSPTTAVNGSTISVSGDYVKVNTSGYMFSSTDAYTTKILSTDTIDSDITVSDNECIFYINGATQVTSGVTSTIKLYESSLNQYCGATWNSVLQQVDIKYASTYPIKRDLDTTNYPVSVKSTDETSVLRRLYYNDAYVKGNTDTITNGAIYYVSNAVKIIEGTSGTAKTYYPIESTYATWISADSPTTSSGKSIRLNSNSRVICGTLGNGFVRTSTTTSATLNGTDTILKSVITTIGTLYAITKFTIDGTEAGRVSTGYSLKPDLTWMNIVEDDDYTYDGDYFEAQEDGSTWYAKVGGTWGSTSDGNALKYVSSKVNANTAIGDILTYNLYDDPSAKSITFHNTSATAYTGDITVSVKYATFAAWFAAKGTSIALDSYLTLSVTNGFVYMTNPDGTANIKNSDGENLEASETITSGTTYNYTIAGE